MRLSTDKLSNVARCRCYSREAAEACTSPHIYGGALAEEARAGVSMPRSAARGGWAACLLRGNSCPALTGTAKWHCSKQPHSPKKRHDDLDFLLTNISETQRRNYTWQAEVFRYLADQSVDSLPDHEACAETVGCVLVMFEVNF